MLIQPPSFLMTNSGNSKIMVYEDKLCKEVYGATMPTVFSAYDMARLYLRTIISA